KGAADAVRCAAASRQVDLTGLAAPVTLWYGEDDPMQDVGEVVAWLGDHMDHLRMFPDIGRFLGHKHWAEVLGWLADG
uniref:hypothetical protein n=1 Tax=Phenylobacterium sp. TaxID=1871053 RepID=UPI00286C2E83